MNMIDVILEAADYLDRQERGNWNECFSKPSDNMAPVIAVKSSEFKHDAVHSFFPSRFVPTEAEHGYASPLPMPDDLRNVTKRPKTKKSQGNR